MSGGSAPSGETRYNWNDDMAPRWNNALNQALWNTFSFQPNGDISGVKPFQAYAGTRFAYPGHYGDNLNMSQGGDIGEANSYVRALNRGSTSPVGAMNAARSQIERTLGGGYMDGGANANPFSNLTVAGNNPFVAGPGSNEFIDQYSTTSRNAFAGNNPFFLDTMRSGLDEITNAYQKGTAADTTRLFNLSGAFGGRAHTNAIANNEAALGKALNNYTDSMLNRQYDRSASLEDSFLARDLQNQQQNRQTSGQWRENQLGRGFQNYYGALDRGSQNWNAERGRQMQATGLGQNEQGLAFQRGQGLVDAGMRSMGFDQRNLDFLYDQNQQMQNHPYRMLDWLTGLYGRAQGGMGANTSVYQGGSSQYAPWLGAALAGASFLGGG